MKNKGEVMLRHSYAETSDKDVFLHRSLLFFLHFQTNLVVENFSGAFG